MLVLGAAACLSGIDETLLGLGCSVTSAGFLISWDLANLVIRVLCMMTCVAVGFALRPLCPTAHILGRYSLLAKISRQLDIFWLTRTQRFLHVI